MDFSKSMSIGENTFLEIQNCEAKVKREISQVRDENHPLVCSNIAESQISNVENSNKSYTRKLSNFKINLKVSQDFPANENSNNIFTSHSLQADESIGHRRDDVQDLDANILCFGEHNNLKHLPVSTELRYHLANEQDTNTPIPHINIDNTFFFRDRLVLIATEMIKMNVPYIQSKMRDFQTIVIFEAESHRKIWRYASWIL